jgi:hypothetical protein
LKTLLVVLVIVALVLPAGCSGGHSDDPLTSFASSSAAADYTLFTIRCSKCHSLSRPLNSGIDSDDYWRLYVAKMRRQPGSGISEDDAVAILRFLHVYSLEQRRKKAQKLGLEPPAEAPSSEPSAASPAQPSLPQPSTPPQSTPPRPPSPAASQPDASSPTGTP